MDTKTKNIVILGAGFAGMQTALLLSKKLRAAKNQTNYAITLIDEHDCHIYAPDLYEIATAYHKKITPECLIKLKDTVAVPIEKIIKNTGINFVRDRVAHIDIERKKIELARRGSYEFDYLVITLGSEVNYYNVPGLEEYAFPLKTLTNALSINCHIDNFFQKLWERNVHKEVEIVIGGGGATGVQLAAEFPLWIKKLCKKYSYPESMVHVRLIEAGDFLGGTRSKKISDIIAKRLRFLGVDVHIKTSIKNVTETHIQTEKNTMPVDVLLWTGGVKPHSIIKEAFGECSAPNGAVPVNGSLQFADKPYVYAAGDNAYIINPDTGKSVPWLAQAAVDQAKIIAQNIACKVTMNNPSNYSRQSQLKYAAYNGKIAGVIIPLGGKFAIFTRGEKATSGFFMWLLRRIVDLRYALSILPFFYAIRKWLHDTNVFVQND